MVLRELEFFADSYILSRCSKSTGPLSYASKLLSDMNDLPETEESLIPKVEYLLSPDSPSMAEHLGITLEVLKRDKVVGSLPVSSKTMQPFGILHGGASVALAETLASIGAWLNVDESRYNVVGCEINANHLRAVRKGSVRGTATPILEAMLKLSQRSCNQ